MKKQILLAAVAFFLSLGTVFGQAPDLFNYQGVARDVNGQALSGQGIKLRLVVRQGSSTGSVLYTEDHSVTTNTYGLYNVSVGAGTPVSNTFSNIDWSNGDKYLQVRIDPNGGSTFTDVGRTQLLSVPFALYAKEAPTKDPIAFRARTVASGTVTTSASSFPIFTSEVFDDGNGYNSSTGEFTAPEDGIYHFETTMAFNVGTAYSSGYMTIGFQLDNGTSFAAITNLHTDDQREFSGNTQCTVKLNSGDKVKVRLFRNVNGTVTYDTNLYYNEFSGFKIN
jgi:hypothetical protein